MAHTPGPWTYEPGDKGDPSVGIGSSPPMVYTSNPDPDYDNIVLATLDAPVANNDADGWPVYHGNEDDNARLMAAAPDLLEALRWLLKRVLRQCDYEHWQDEIIPAEAAIKKAEGA